MCSTGSQPCSPFDQLHCDEVVPISTVEDDEAIGRGGLKLKKQVHCGISLQSGQSQVAALGPKGDRVGDYEAHAKAGVELAEIDVPVLAHVDILHAVELEALRGKGGKKRCCNVSCTLLVIEIIRCDE